MNVPKPQIVNLRDKRATRSAIIEALENLATSEKIKHGDPIVIFFAGHGSEVCAPKGWDAAGAKIQMIIPSDYNTNSNGKLEVAGIPDRTFGAILRRIAEAKGDNIVRSKLIALLLPES